MEEEEADLGDAPDDFLDPITMELMADPVVLPSTKARDYAQRDPHLPPCSLGARRPHGRCATVPRSCGTYSRTSTTRSIVPSGIPHTSSCQPTIYY